jgi:hypothetical protein
VPETSLNFWRFWFSVAPILDLCLAVEPASIPNKIPSCLRRAHPIPVFQSP